MYSKYIGQTKIAGGILMHYIDPHAKAGPNGEFKVQSDFLPKEVYAMHQKQQKRMSKK